jgi:hypothetical protein
MNYRNKTVAIAVIMVMLSSTVGIYRANAAWAGYVKPAYPDYAPSGMPDFDEKQDMWGPSPGWYTWCGPVAVANSLWWLDSKYESLINPATPNPPPVASDHFGLLSAYGAWDDHSQQNVDPFVRNLAFLMDTDGQRTSDGHIGTRTVDLMAGINQYLIQQGTQKFFEVHDMNFPNFTWIDHEVEICQDVELFLDFWQWTGSSWAPITNPPSFEAGHFVTCAGANPQANPGEVLISDPFADTFEAGFAPRGGLSPVAHMYPHSSIVHNDAQYVSQDGYQVAQYVGPPPSPYPPGQQVWELVGYLQALGYGGAGTWHTFIRWAVATSPVEVPQWEGYVKPSYPDYAPSGMPDFDENQDQWGPAPGTYTWCGPVAVANSLWWLDSKYESLVNPAPVAPPTISDNYGLVTSYNPLVWDDHDPQNVDPLVRELATLMDTDGQQSGIPHLGTNWMDLENGIRTYLMNRGLDTAFEVHDLQFPDFPWIDHEVEICQDVELFLEFYRWDGIQWTQPITNPSLEAGHFVACAGSNPNLNPGQVLISDPLQDAFEAGTAPGQAPIHAYPHGTWVHNDTLYVSHDAYQVAQWIGPGPYGPQQSVWELVGYLQTLGYDQNFHAFIRVAIATSPVEGSHDVAVTAVTTAKTGCAPKPTIGRNQTISINVTVQNQGASAETFNVRTYANATLINTTSVSLAGGASMWYIFTWNTSGFAYGNYTISGVADTVLGETDTVDNTYSNCYIIITIPGDIDGNGHVQLNDLVMLANAYGSTPGTPKWSPNADIDNNNVVGLSDLVIMAKHYGM